MNSQPFRPQKDGGETYPAPQPWPGATEPGRRFLEYERSEQEDPPGRGTEEGGDEHGNVPQLVHLGF